MNKSAEIIDAIIEQFSDELKSREPYSYADHANLLVDLGWDVCQGDGEISNVIEEMLSSQIGKLPEHIMQLLWWESWGGQSMKRNILEALKNVECDLSKITRPESDEVIEDVIDYSKSKLFIKAEAAFDDY